MGVMDDLEKYQMLPLDDGPSGISRRVTRARSTHLAGIEKASKVRRVQFCDAAGATIEMADVWLPLPRIIIRDELGVSVRYILSGDRYVRMAQ
jgi:hypothetical protein